MINLLDTTRNLPCKSFFHNETLKRAFVRCIEIAGEASKNLSEEFKISHDQIDWRTRVRMRDKLIHEYFGIDFQQGIDKKQRVRNRSEKRQKCHGKEAG